MESAFSKKSLYDKIFKTVFVVLLLSSLTAGVVLVSNKNNPTIKRMLAGVDVGMPGSGLEPPGTDVDKKDEKDKKDSKESTPQQPTTLQIAQKAKENSGQTSSTSQSSSSGALEGCGGGVSTSACFCTISNCYYNDTNNKTYTIPKNSQQYKELQKILNNIDEIGGTITESYSRLALNENDKLTPLTPDVISQKAKEIDQKLEQETLDSVRDLVRNGEITDYNLAKSIAPEYTQQQFKNDLSYAERKYGSAPEIPTTNLSKTNTSSHQNAIQRDQQTKNIYNQENTTESTTTYQKTQNTYLAVPISLSQLNYLVNNQKINQEQAQNINPDYSPAIPNNNQSSQPFTFYTQTQTNWGNIVVYKTIDSTPILFRNVACGGTVIANILRLAGIKEITPPEVYSEFLPNDENLLLSDSQVVSVLEENGLSVSDETSLSLKTVGQFTNAGSVVILTVDMGANNNCEGNYDCSDHFTLLTGESTDFSGNTVLTLQDPFYGEMSCSASNDMSCRTSDGSTVKYKVYKKYTVKIPNSNNQ